MSPCHLTLKQLEIIAALAAGKTAAQIAKETGRSKNTINRHISIAFTIVGVSNSPALVATALRRGWIL